MELQLIERRPQHMPGMGLARWRLHTLQAAVSAAIAASAGLVQRWL